MVGTCIVCNKCHALFAEGLKFLHYAAPDLRIIARYYGWAYPGKKDLCPKCRPKKKNGKLFVVNKKRKLHGDYN